MKKLLTPIIVIVLIAGGLGLNYQLNTATDKDTGQTQQQRPPQKPAQAPKRPPAAASPYASSADKTGPVDEETFGKPGSPETVSIGYSWTPDLLKDQSGLKQILTDAQRWAALPGRCVRVVCVDIPPDQRQSPSDADVQQGVAVSGKGAPALTGNPGTDINPAQFAAMLASLK